MILWFAVGLQQKVNYVHLAIDIKSKIPAADESCNKCRKEFSEGTIKKLF